MNPDSDKEPGQSRTQSNFHGSVDWKLRQGSPVRGLLNLLEPLSLAFEGFIDRIAGNPAYNPLYHTGTITTFFLLVILGTGIYLTFFYEFGFDSSYQAVSAIEANFVGRIIRALHSYASGAAVFTALLHGWRIFFQDRFRGPRWLAWVSGIGMSAVVWAIGISGYWLIWDERAGILNQTLFDFLQGSKLGVAFLIRTLVSDQASTGWIFMLIMITIHLGLSGLVGLFYWWHIKRLNRPKLLPPRYWMVLSGGLLLAVALLVPLGMLPQADPGKIAAIIPLDLFYLFYLPAALKIQPWIFGLLVLLLFGISASFPWLMRGKTLPPIRVSRERCIGCTLCEVDCPYRAISMVERKDENRNKYLAEVNPDLCVACGVCIGSCPTMALTLGQLPAEPLWEQAVARARGDGEGALKIVFTCERHVFQGAKPYLSEPDSKIIPVTCAGMIHPDLLAKTIEAVAEEVQVIGCPPEDCLNREGNRHLQERIWGVRKPILRSKYADAKITTDWVPPNDFTKALKTSIHQSGATTYTHSFQSADWLAAIPMVAVLVMISILVILANRFPYQPEISRQAGIAIVMDHQPGYPLANVANTLEPDPGITADMRLVLEVDDEVVLDQTYPVRGREEQSKTFERYFLAPGHHEIRLVMMDREDPKQVQVLWDETLTLAAGDIIRLNIKDEDLGNDPKAGEKLYYESSLGTNVSCIICHSLEPGENLVGPSFAGIATRAASRIPGLSAEAYLRQSILEPDAFVVEGYPSGLMIPNLGETLTEAQIGDLIAFLMTLK